MDQFAQFETQKQLYFGTLEKPQVRFYFFNILSAYANAGGKQVTYAVPTVW